MTVAVQPQPHAHTDSMSAISASSATSPRPARSGSVGRSNSQQGSITPGRRASVVGNPAALDEGDLDEEAGYEGEDGDEDDDEAITLDQGQEMVNETTVKSGYLYKRGEKRKNWKKRWFVLRSCKLYYYKNEKEYQLLRFIDMSEVHTIAAVSLKKADHVFGISTSKRQYYVRASNAKEMQSWVDALREVREQVRQRSTITRDLGTLDISSPGSASENAPPPSSLGATGATLLPQSGRRPSLSGSSSPNLAPVDRANPPGGSAPISIVIPGKGTYTAPAQPRIATSGVVLSPLSVTSESEAGGPSGAEQFGLSYTSSTGQSLGSSPGRSGLLQQHFLHSGESNAAAVTHQPGFVSEEATEAGVRRSRVMQRPSGRREASVGSSGGEGGSAAAATAGGSGFSLGRRSSSQKPLSSVQNTAQVLSSSEEEGDGDGDGDEWDEDEEADRAMPLPSPGGLGLVSHMHGSASTVNGKQDHAKHAGQPSTGDVHQTHALKPKVDPEFFKDSGKVIHQGYLMKQSNRRKHWRKRWFVLTSSTLSYTRSHMDGKASRQIPLSSILDAIEYTSKKATNQAGAGAGASSSSGGAPLSPSLSAAFGSGAGGLPFGRSPLLGGAAEAPPGQVVERRQSVTSQQSKPSILSPGAQASASTASDAEQQTSAATGAAMSGNESEGAQAPSSVAERKVTVAPNQPTAATQLAAERQNSVSSTVSQSTSSTPAKKKKENCFKIITPKRVFIVCAPTEEEELKWLSALQALLAHYQDQNDKNDATPLASSATGALSAMQQQDPQPSHTQQVQPQSQPQQQSGQQVQQQNQV